MENKDIIFAKPCEVLIGFDTYEEYVGLNENGQYVLGFIVDETDNYDELHLYIIAKPFNLIEYFYQEQSAYQLAKSAFKVYEVKKNIKGEILNFRILIDEELEREYKYLTNAFSLIEPPKCLPEIEKLQLDKSYKA